MLVSCLASFFSFVQQFCSKILLSFFQSFVLKHKYTLRRLILALRAAWGTAVRMEPKAHLGQSYNKQPDVDAVVLSAGVRRVAACLSLSLSLRLY